MTKNDFQKIEQYIGANLLNYILNVDFIKAGQLYEDYTFTPRQEDTLDDFKRTIQEIKIAISTREETVDNIIFYLRRMDKSGFNLFNWYRRACGQTLDEFTCDDKLLEHIINLFYREYPLLILKTTENIFPSDRGLNLSVTDYDLSIKLVKEDILDNIANDKEGFEYAFDFSTENGLEFKSQISMFTSNIIMRSFQNACNKMAYTKNDIIEEIKLNLSLLRDLAQNKETEYSTFIGIRGLMFEDFSTIDLKGACLYQLDSIENPSPHVNKIAIKSDNGLSGHILEIKHMIKLSLNKPTGTKSNSRDEYDFQDKVIESLRFATSFSLLEDKGFTQTFTETGFPIVQIGNFSEGRTGVYKQITIPSSKKLEIQTWYKFLYDTDLSYVKIPLKRLTYAIYQRTDPEDAIIDAVIAWEGMFSEAHETSFKVTGSITKYLAKDDSQIFLTRIKKLYTLRSDIVHGKNNRLLEREDINELRSEVIQIGLECLQKLIKDEKLLKMEASQRVTELLVFS